MSVDYDLYLEGRVRSEWRCLSPFFAAADGSLVLSPILSGQSAVGSMLSDIGCWYSCPKDLSKEVKHVLWKKEDENGTKTNEIDESCVQWFSFSDVVCNPARFEHEAFVLREAMNAFEIGELEEIWEWLTPQEYGELSGAEKQAYTFYRWTQPYGIYDLKCRLKVLGETLKDMYRDTVLLHEDGYPEISEMRVVVSIG